MRARVNRLVQFLARTCLVPSHGLSHLSASKMDQRLSQHIGILTRGLYVWALCAILVLDVSEFCLSNVGFHSLNGIVYSHRFESASTTEATSRRTTPQNVGTTNKHHHELRTPNRVHSLCVHGCLEGPRPTTKACSETVPVGCRWQAPYFIFLVRGSWGAEGVEFVLLCDTSNDKQLTYTACFNIPLTF